MMAESKIDYDRQLRDAVWNLMQIKGHPHSEIAYGRLEEAYLNAVKHAPSGCALELTDHQAMAMDEDAIRAANKATLDGNVMSATWTIAYIRAILGAVPVDWSSPCAIEAAKTEAYRLGVHDERLRQKEDQKPRTNMATPSTHSEKVYTKGGTVKTVPRRIPTTPEEMIECIGPHYFIMTFGDALGEYADKTRVRYELTVHDLL